MLSPNVTNQYNLKKDYTDDSYWGLNISNRCNLKKDNARCRWARAKKKIVSTADTEPSISRRYNLKKRSYWMINTRSGINRQHNLKKDCIICQYKAQY